MGFGRETMDANARAAARVAALARCRNVSVKVTGAALLFEQSPIRSAT
jgi:hypothetical protein